MRYLALDIADTFGVYKVDVMDREVKEVVAYMNSIRGVSAVVLPWMCVPLDYCGPKIMDFRNDWWYLFPNGGMTEAEIHASSATGSEVK